jgi:hypothetical protein
VAGCPVADAQEVRGARETPKTQKHQKHKTEKSTPNYFWFFGGDCDLRFARVAKISR